MKHKRTEKLDICAMFLRWILGQYVRRICIPVICLIGLFMVLFYVRYASVTMSTRSTSYLDNFKKHFNLKSAQVKAMETENPKSRHNEDVTRTLVSTTEMKLEIKEENDRLLNAMGLKPIHRKFMKFQYPITINRPYLIENPTLCSSVPNLMILVIVHTAPDHFEKRQNARRTWTNETYFQDLGCLKILFLLGRVKDAVLQKRIDQEFTDHKDLLQGDFIDAYHNLTHKGVMAYKWITQRCRNAKLIVKVDDDVMVDTYKLFTAPEYLPFFKNKTKQILCNHILPDTMPIIRDSNSKWFVNETEFRDESFYPRYCSGFLVMISNDVIPAIYRAATVTPFFWVDDMYLYGLAPIRVPGIRYDGIKPGTHMLSVQEGIQCYRNLSMECNYIVVGAPNAEFADTVWETMTYIYRHGGQRPTSPKPPTTLAPAPQQNRQQQQHNQLHRPGTSVSQWLSPKSSSLGGWAYVPSRGLAQKWKKKKKDQRQRGKPILLHVSN